MRSLLNGLSGLALIFSACSSDSAEQEVGGLTAAGAGGGQGTSSSSTEPGATEPGTEPGTGEPAATGGGGSSGSQSNEGGPMTSGLVGAAGTSGGGSAPAAGEMPPAMMPPMMAGEMPPAADASCPPGPFAASPLPAMPQPTDVCTGMTFTEGPVWFASLNTLFFSDFTVSNFAGPSRILSFTPGGQCEDFISNAGTNGLVIAPDGNLLGARHGDQTLTIFNLMTKEPTVLVADNGGLAFNSPNDIAVRSDGNLYFTDPSYLRGNRPQEQPLRAYRRDPSGALTVIEEGVDTNGITLSPDESRLYVSQLGFGAGGGNNILAFDVDAAGAVSNRQTFVAGTGSDGMAIDCAGNLYITSNGVQVFSPQGQPLGTIPAQGAANVAFGGPERRTLFITATTRLLAVELAIPGLPY